MVNDKSTIFISLLFIFNLLSNAIQIDRKSKLVKVEMEYREVRKVVRRSAVGGGSLQEDLLWHLHRLKFYLLLTPQRKGLVRRCYYDTTIK